MTRNSEALDSFIEYCESHPHERFWQALRNWSRFSFILGSAVPPCELTPTNSARPWVDLCDTFYVEGLDATRKS